MQNEADFRVFRLPQMAIAAVGAGLLFAALGVYGTDQTPFLESAACWIGSMILGFATAAFVAPPIFTRTPEQVPDALKIAAASAIISIPIVASMTIFSMWGAAAKEPGATLVNFVYVWIISSIVTTLGYLADRLDRSAAGKTAADAAEPTETPRSDFMRRAPARLRSADLYAVEAEDHYLRLHTSAGSDLILLRLSDAIAELATVEGLQTHRSWWVARAGVAEIVRRNGKHSLRLKSGAEAPVSRTFAADVKASGWERSLSSAD